MSHEIRANYEQIMMFPPSLEDWISQDHPARFIRDLVRSLDLKAMGFRVPDTTVGRPRYAAELLLAVWLYGYFNRIRSTRKLERACRENMGLIWLTGMNEPDHNSLWRFFNFNREALCGLYKQSVKVALKCGMVGLAVHAVDGTKIRCASSSDKMRSSLSFEKMHEKLDQSVADFMTEIERQEQEEQGDYKLPPGMDNALKRKQKISNAFCELQEKEVKRVHHCEPEARLMKGRRNVDLAYNAQAVADRDSGIIVAAEVFTDASDNGLMVPMLDRVQENLGATADANLSDGAYFSGSQIGLAEERGYEVLINKPASETTSKQSRKNAVYEAKQFTYDEERNCCICPHGVELPYLSTKVRGTNHNPIRVYRCRVRECPHRSKCTKNKRGREIEISVHHKAIERLREKWKDPAAQRLLAQRKRIIEPVFAWIKSRLGFTQWTVAGLDKVRAQWYLVCTEINLMKLYKRWRTGGLQFAAA
jgi:transposase